MISLNGEQQQALQPVHVRVPILSPNPLQRVLFRFKLMKPDRLFIIRPSGLATISRIGRLIRKINIPDGFLNDSEELSAQVNDIILKHCRVIAVMITVSIQNREGKPSRETVNYLLNNLTSDDMLKVLSVVVHQMNYGAVLRSLATLKGLNIFRKPDSAEE